jgi:hypothetical protein
VRPLLFVAVVAVVACRPPPAAVPGPTAITKDVAAAETTNAPGHVAPTTPARSPLTPAAGPDTGSAPADLVARVETEVSRLRELPFKRRVRFERQSRDEFRTFIRTEIARELPPERNAALSRGYHVMGMLPRPLDLAQALEEEATMQVAAYYDPRSDVFRVLGTGDGDLETVVAHELDHALAHQHFDLIQYQGGEGNRAGLSDDERTARNFVVEGEATFLMMAKGMSGGSGGGVALGPLQVAGLRMGVQMFAAADVAEIAALVRRGAVSEAIDAESRAQLEQLAELPPLLVMSMVEPYAKGALFVSEVWAHGGWPAVGRLYSDPPESSEQVLHPTDKFITRRDPPVHIRFAAGREPFDGRKPAVTDVNGELGWRCYFKTWKLPDPAAAAAGWGGDRYWFWERPLPGEARATPPGALVVVATRWDTPADAARFRAAYLRSLPERFPRVKAAVAGDTVRLRRPDGTLLVVSARGLDVDVIDGARPPEVPALLAALAAAERTTERGARPASNH